MPRKLKHELDLLTTAPRVADALDEMIQELQKISSVARAQQDVTIDVLDSFVAIRTIVAEKLEPRVKEWGRCSVRINSWQKSYLNRIMWSLYK